MKEPLLALVFHVFSSKNAHIFNIKGASKAIEVVIKTGQTSVNNRSFSISQEPTA